MTNDQNTSKPRFKGIFNSLGKMFLKDEFKNAEEEAEKEEVPLSAPQQATTPVAVKQPQHEYVQPQTIGIGNIDEMVKKIYGIFKKINEPGIDFMELWDSAMAMGGVTVQNLQASFTTLNIVSGGSLTVEALISSGNKYKEQLNRLMGEDVTNKQEQRQNLVMQQANDRQQLEGEVRELTKKITEMQQELTEKSKQLAGIDSKYSPQINEIDQKISGGTAALQRVTTEIDGVLQKIPQIKTS